MVARRTVDARRVVATTKEVVADYGTAGVGGVLGRPAFQDVGHVNAAFAVPALLQYEAFRARSSAVFRVCEKRRAFLHRRKGRLEGAQIGCRRRDDDGGSGYDGRRYRCDWRG